MYLWRQELWMQWIIHLLSLLLGMTPDRHSVRNSVCQQHLLSLHQTPSALWDVIQLNTSLVTLHGRDRSIHILRVIHWEENDKLTVKSFLLQQGGSFIHSSQETLVQKLPIMQREAWQRNSINSERGTLVSASTPLGTQGSGKWELIKALPSTYCAPLLHPAG